MDFLARDFDDTCFPESRGPCSRGSKGLGPMDLEDSFSKKRILQFFLVERVEVGNLCMGSTVGFRYLLALNICVPYNLGNAWMRNIYVEMKEMSRILQNICKI